MNRFQVYVKNTSNCEGFQLRTFQSLGPTWEGTQVEIPFGPEREKLPVVGWSDLFFGSQCSVKIARILNEGRKGYLVYGGNSGLRVDPNGDAWGTPIIWVENREDLPEEVLAVTG